MNSLIGLWLFVGLFYHGEVRPPLNPDLRIYYSFINETENELYYYRNHEDGYCRRRALYKIKDSWIEQKITFVDPNNHSSCAMDPDMQLGKISYSHFRWVNRQFYLEVPMGQEKIEFIFEPISGLQ